MFKKEYYSASPLLLFIILGGMILFCIKKDKEVHQNHKNITLKSAR